MLIYGNRVYKEYDWLLHGCGHQCINRMIGCGRGVDTGELTVGLVIAGVWTPVY
jgi:hypothetical protein